jgi:hypothetical protein
MFDATQIRGAPLNRNQTTHKEWTYATITDHPLDDIHPLAFASYNPLT